MLRPMMNIPDKEEKEEDKETKKKKSLYLNKLIQDEKSLKKRTS